MTDPAIFRAEIDTRTLRQAVHILEPAGSGEIRFEVTADGVTATVLRPDRMGGLSILIGRAAWGTLEVTRPGPVVLDHVKLTQILRVPRGRARIRIEQAPGIPEQCLRLTVLTDELHPVVRTCAILDPDGAPAAQLPALDPRAWADGVDSEGLSTLVRDIEQGAAHVKLSRTKGGVRLAGLPTEGAQNISEGEVTSGQVRGGGTAAYPADVLGPIIRALKPADTVSFAWARGAPLAISFEFAGAGISGLYVVAAWHPDDGDEPTVWWDRSAGLWYAWAMRCRSPTEPEWGAASICGTPTDAYDAEAARVRAENSAAAARYAADRAEYESQAASYAPRYEMYQQMRAGFIARWLETHKRAPATVTIRRQLGDAPRAPTAPTPPKLLEPWRTEWDHRDVPDREYRRELRGHGATGVSWGVARQESKVSDPSEIPSGSEPVVAHASPAMVAAFGMRPLVDAGLVVEMEPEVSEPVPTPPDGPEGPFREPDPDPFVGQMGPEGGGAPDCVVCLGWGRVYSRTRDYACPGCGGTEWADRPAGPTAADLRDDCVTAVIRGYRLAHGRDAE